MTTPACRPVPLLTLVALLASACTPDGPPTSPPEPDAGYPLGPDDPCGTGQATTCCEDVLAHGTGASDRGMPPFTYDAPPDLVDGDDVALAGGPFDATWTTVRAGTGGRASELVLDRGGREVVLAFASAPSAIPTLAPGTPVRVERPSADSNGVWIRDAEGTTIALVTERGRDLAVGPFEIEPSTPADCLVPTYVWSGGWGWCWIGAFRYAAELAGTQLPVGVTTSIGAEGATYDVTLHRLQVQDGILTSTGSVGCAPRVLDELVLEAWLDL